MTLFSQLSYRYVIEFDHYRTRQRASCPSVSIITRVAKNKKSQTETFYHSPVSRLLFRAGYPEDAIEERAGFDDYCLPQLLFLLLISVHGV